MTSAPHHAWSVLGDVFDAAAQLSPEDQPGILDAACANRPDFRASVERLLAADARAVRQPDFLGESFVAFARIVHTRAKWIALPDYGFSGPLSTSSQERRSNTQT